MKIASKTLSIVFNLTCYTILAYLAYLQFQYFLANHDSSSVYYKKFVNHKEDVYPTFSVCLVYYHGGLYHKSMGNLAGPYWNFLLGNDENYTKDFTKTNFDEVIMNPKEVVKFYKRKGKGSDNKYKEEKITDFNSAFKLTHQEPSATCFTKKETPEEGKLLKYDLVQINLDVIYGGPKIQQIGAYIHPKGQLIRKSSRPTYTAYWKTLKQFDTTKGFKYILRFQNNAIEVLRKRPDAAKKCNDKLLDEDRQWRLSVAEEIRCIPAFMGRFLLNSNTERHLQNLPPCNLLQYRQIYENYSNFDNFEAAAQLYVNPCLEISSVVTKDESIVYLENSNSSTLIFKFNYVEDYRETINKRSFNLMDLWSQIGGFVGIFIGYSLMQIPEMLFNLYGLAKYPSTKKNAG